MKDRKGPMGRNPFRAKRFGLSIFWYIKRRLCFPEDNSRYINMCNIITGFERELPVFAVILIIRVVILVMQFQKTT